MLRLVVPHHRIRHPIASIGLLATAALLPIRATAQQSVTDSGGPAKGLNASGGLALKTGAAELQRAGGSQFVGVEIDLGRFAGSRTRFLVESTFLRGGLREFVELEARTYDGHIYDLTGAITAVQLLRAPSRRVQPFLSGSLSVHAMSSSFGSTILDRRYNTNNFGAQAGIGMRVRLGRRGHRALVLELRRTTVHDMNRLSLSIGLMRLMRDLAVPLG
ncbi:MAG: hypothetical protein AB1762_13055 [Gemmatimonadota bacterium]